MQAEGVHSPSCIITDLSSLPAWRLDAQLGTLGVGGAAPPTLPAHPRATRTGAAAE